MTQLQLHEDEIYYADYTEIRLTNVEQALAKCVGKERHEINRDGERKKHYQYFWRKGWDTPENCIWLDTVAMGAELAFCKTVNIYPDLKIAPGKPAWNDDAVINGCTVDVKCRIARNLQFDIPGFKDKKPCDIYMLMKARLEWLDEEMVPGYRKPNQDIFPTYHIIGWCHRDVAFSREHWVPPKEGQTHHNYHIPLDKIHKDWTTISKYGPPAPEVHPTVKDGVELDDILG